MLHRFFFPIHLDEKETGFADVAAVSFHLGLHLEWCASEISCTSLAQVASEVPDAEDQA